MPNYLRWRTAGGMVFLTVVAHQRYPLFDDQLARKLLRAAIVATRCEMPCDFVAFCLLPDHFHCVMQLPEADSNYSDRVQSIKTSFTQQWLASGGWEGPISQSRKLKGERGIWQRRFWEHTVRDEEDLHRCVDYIHWNPRKHKRVSRIRDYPHSSFHRFVQLGHYETDWGHTDPCGDWPDAEYLRE